MHLFDFEEFELMITKCHFWVKCSFGSRDLICLYIYIIINLHKNNKSVYGTSSFKYPYVSALLDSWDDRTPLHDAALQGRLLPLRRLLSQVLMEETLV